MNCLAFIAFHFTNITPIFRLRECELVPTFQFPVTSMTFQFRILYYPVQRSRTFVKISNESDIILFTY